MSDTKPFQHIDGHRNHHSIVAVTGRYRRMIDPLEHPYIVCRMLPAGTLPIQRTKQILDSLR
jgi:hypothetical protein